MINSKILIPAMLVTALALTGCGKPPVAQTQNKVEVELNLMPEDLLLVSATEMSQGPMISGSLQPVVKAELNAEVSGIVLKILKDNGDTVKAGELLVQLDPTNYRDKLLSAQEAKRSAQVTVAQAQKQYQRMLSLQKQNLVTTELLETAEIKFNQAQSELASAKARLVEAQQQMDRTAVRAPFSGVVAARKASAGDTAQVGKALMVIIDPASMRFEGFISSEMVGAVKVGNAVNFKVNGYPDQRFDGIVDRINPQANEQTRQVQMFVSIDQQTPLVAGLYAEGYIAVAKQQALMLPPSALVQEGDNQFVWQVTDNTLIKQKVQVGVTDPRWGTVQILEGLQVGSQILLHPLGTIKDGGKVSLGTKTPAPAHTTAAGF